MSCEQRNDRKFLLREEEHPDSLFKAMRPVITLGQWFALFPFLSGLRGPNNQFLRNNWRSWKVIYAAYCLCWSVFISYCCILTVWTRPITFSALPGILYYTMSMASAFLNAKLNAMWPALSKEFSAMEMVFKRHGYPKLQLRFKVLLSFFMLSAAVEHCAGLVQALKRVLPCVTDNRISSILESFFLSNFNKVYSVTGYRFWTGFVLMHVNVVFKFWWNYLDIFLALVAMAVSARFSQLYQYLDKHKGRARSVIFWRTAREEFNCLSQLTRTLDTALGAMIIFSFFTDVGFICWQLLRNMNPVKNVLQKVYFTWSFGFFVFRALLAFFSMAEINNRAKQFKSFLYCVPSTSYSFEVEQFLRQVDSDGIAFTAYGFMTVSRATILTIAGTVITYEIVLVQFNAFNGVDSWPTNSTAASCIHASSFT